MISAIAHNRRDRFARGWLAGRAVLLGTVISLVSLTSPVSSQARAEKQAEKPSQSAKKSKPSETLSNASDSENEQPSRESEQSEVEMPRIHSAMYLPGDEAQIRRIGATAIITEVSSGLPFPARVDTGATCCSIHCEKMEIENPGPEPVDNVGKPIRFLVRNHEGETEWIKAKIVERVTVRTTTDDDERYKVPLKLRWQDVEKKVLVTLCDRGHMQYPLLLGRNFLSGDFVVDVALDGDQ